MVKPNCYLNFYQHCNKKNVEREKQLSYHGAQALMKNTFRLGMEEITVVVLFVFRFKWPHRLAPQLGLTGITWKSTNSNSHQVDSIKVQT